MWSRVEARNDVVFAKSEDGSDHAMFKSGSKAEVVLLVLRPIHFMGANRIQQSLGGTDEM